MEAVPVWIALGRNAVVNALGVCFIQPQRVRFRVPVRVAVYECKRFPVYESERVRFRESEFFAQFEPQFKPKLFAIY